MHASAPNPHSTRDALLDAAEQLFSSRGYAAVGIREIAETAHANLAAIKYYFGSKSELYLATVRRTMSRGEAEAIWDLLRDKPADASSAAAVLVRFIHTFLSRLLSPGEGKSCCNLMVREATEPSEAIDAVVRDFIRPHRDMLMQVISVLRPEMSADKLAMSAQSVLAQVLHYRVFRGFVERLDAAAMTDPSYAREKADHIARFSLAALGCDSKLIERAIEANHQSRDAGAIVMEGSAP